MTNSEREAIKACNMAGKMKPRPASWGVFCYGDASPAIGGGLGGFFWFKTRLTMLRFIGQHLAYIDSGIEDFDYALAQKRVETILAQHGRKNDDVEKIRRGINRILKGHTQIAWMGHFEALLSGNSAFAREIRAFYWRESDQKGTAPINGRNMSPFISAINEYGI